MWGDELEQLGAELGRGRDARSVRVDQLCRRSEASRRPPVLRVVGSAAVAEPVARGELTGERGRAERPEERRERDGERDVGRLVGDANLERAEPRMRTHVPPDAG